MDARLVSNYLSSLREKTGLTYEAIAEKSGRSESTVKNLCRGKTEGPASRYRCAGCFCYGRFIG